MVYRQYWLSPYSPLERANSLLSIAGGSKKYTRIADAQDYLFASNRDRSLSAFKGLGCRISAHDNAWRDLGYHEEAPVKHNRDFVLLLPARTHRAASDVLFTDIRLLRRNGDPIRA